MKKLLLISLTITTIFLQSCDERIAPLDNQAGVAITVSKTDLLARKWAYDEVYYVVDAKKTAIYGAAKPASVKITVGATPNDYYLFSKDGKLTVYDDTKKTTTTGTWKFIQSEKQVELIYQTSDVIFDIITLTDKNLELSLNINVANIAKESQDIKSLYAIGALGGLIVETSKSVQFGEKFLAK